jgi:hypothetical protein
MADARDGLISYSYLTVLSGESPFAVIYPASPHQQLTEAFLVLSCCSTANHVYSTNITVFFIVPHFGIFGAA